MSADGSVFVPESVEAWWARRRWSKDVDVPYPIGRYRDDWQRFPVLVRQYHPDLNHGLMLSQVPPAADVYLVWECATGHRFVATPTEQRARPGGSRRRSTWCPECAELARPRRAPVPAPTPVERFGCGHPRDPRRLDDDPGDDRCALCRRLDSSRITRDELIALATPQSREAVAGENGSARRHSWQCAEAHPSFQATVERILSGVRCPTCHHAAAGAAAVAPGDAFVSGWAPKPSSAAESELRQRLGKRLEVTLSDNAVRVSRPFFTHLEVWPDVIVPELRVAIEYDTMGRDGLEHTGRREAVDRRKDRLLRAVGWEVVRIRCGRLVPIGPFDIVASGVTDKLLAELVERLEEIRGALIVGAYRR
ncbi:zinc-ribbon domain-containing protein [Leifsonia poae]|uniref:zinc-ribbon domain-containing protein n=1 Tax=Leifsonia poae TaxID=110933 RepID=UPI001CBFBB81|nr:zinc-ribbon domain-containing protein [Leifsonia poae]